MKKISIILPYQSDNGPRDKAFSWVKKFYEATMPEAELIISSQKNGTINVSHAFNNAAETAAGDIFVLADADIIYNPAILDEAIKLLEKYPCVIPFRGVVDLSQDKTNKLLETEPNWPLNTTIDDYSIDNKYGSFGGKLKVMSRETYKAAGGFDERFVGWGGEDDAFIYALKTLCGPFKKLENQVIHLWHPKINWYNAPNAKDNRSLLKRYNRAIGNKEDMLKLISERKRPIL
ncbi:hypothetical protein GCM10011351_12590 [Paraliobacillus quinghaiensis]|uniref:Galactosyltransferase C-terminal domain-containing protein n=1 Tax=Paraliobacillus quinghaiensis TaxID=470815 RepID=A0A917TLP4_9BACI|nr:glycosyltransferase family 2 protein [Paraliobacillus quinghaiensis]GGM28165.1 hypothetical protein GCM10011351_12590 [Paraliobacillus quinghaiensis]